MATSDAECPICLEPIITENKMVLPKCKHVIHSSCFCEFIEKNLDNVSCPLCREHLLKIPEKVTVLEIHTPAPPLDLDREYVQKNNMLAGLYFTSFVLFMLWFGYSSLIQNDQGDHK